MFEKFLDIIHWWYIERVFEEWVYPGYYLKNLLFHRHDRIKVPQVKPYEFSDVTDLMLYVNMELIVKFVEKENPEKYICWYTDSDGNELGHKYGECEKYPIVYPEYKGKWVMDIVKEIYHFWKVEYPEYLKDEIYLLHFWSNYFYTDEIEEMPPKKIVTCLDDFNTENINWNILDKYLDRNKLFETDYVLSMHSNMQIEMENRITKYLHLCMDIRRYLWT